MKLLKLALALSILAAAACFAANLAATAGAVSVAASHTGAGR